VRGRLVLEGDAWLVVGSPPRVLMMIRLLASAATGGSPSIAVLPPGTSVWKRHDPATSSETTKWVSTMPSGGAGNSAL